MPSFGYLYEPLRLLGLRRYDLERFQEFLTEHAGHRLYLSCGEDEDAPAELLALEEDEEAAKRLYAELDEEEALKTRRSENGEFVEARYVLVCSCGSSYESDEPDLLLAFEEFGISSDAIALFLERWGSRLPDEGWNHRVYGVVDPYEPFMEGLPGFLRSHSGHQLEAKLSRD